MEAPSDVSITLCIFHRESELNQHRWEVQRLCLVPTPAQSNAACPQGVLLSSPVPPSPWEQGAHWACPWALFIPRHTPVSAQRAWLLQGVRQLPSHRNYWQCQPPCYYFMQDFAGCHKGSLSVPLHCSICDSLGTGSTFCFLLGPISHPRRGCSNDMGGRSSLMRLEKWRRREPWLWRGAAHAGGKALELQTCLQLGTGAHSARDRSGRMRGWGSGWPHSPLWH